MKAYLVATFAPPTARQYKPHWWHHSSVDPLVLQPRSTTQAQDDRIMSHAVRVPVADAVCRKTLHCMWPNPSGDLKTLVCIQALLK